MTTTTSPISDSSLLHAYLQGSQPAFTTLVSRYLPMVYAAARRQVADSTTAEDITQAVFILLAQKAPKLTRHPLLSAWLHRTTYCCAANARKLAHRRSQHEQEAATMKPTHTLAPDLTIQELSPLLDSALIALAPADRHVLILHYLQSYTLEQTGATLGLSKDATHQRILRALDKLRRLLTQRGITTLSLTTGATTLGLLLATPTLAAPPMLNSPLLLPATLTATATAATAGTLPTCTALTLSQGVLQLMTIAKVKLVAALAISGVILTTTGAVVVHEVLAKDAIPPDSHPATTVTVSTESPQNMVERFLELIKEGDPQAANLMAKDFDPQCQRFVSWGSNSGITTQLMAEFRQLRTGGLSNLDANAKKYWTAATIGTYPWIMITGERAVVWLNSSGESMEDMRQLLLKRQDGHWQIAGLCKLNMASLQWQLDSAATTPNNDWGNLLVVTRTQEEIEKQPVYVDLDTGRTFAPPAGDVTDSWIAANGIDVGLGAYDPHSVPHVGTVSYGLSMKGIHSYWLATPAMAQALIADGKPGNGKFAGGPFVIQTREGTVGLLIEAPTELKFMPMVSPYRGKTPPQLGLSDTARLFLAAASYPLKDEALLTKLVAPGLDVNQVWRMVTYNSEGVYPSPMAYQKIMMDGNKAFALTYPDERINGSKRQVAAFLVLFSKHGNTWLADEVRLVRNQEIDDAITKFQVEHPHSSDELSSQSPHSNGKTSP